MKKILDVVVVATFAVGVVHAADPATAAEPQPDEKRATQKPADSGKQPNSAAQPRAHTSGPAQDRASKHGFKKKPEDINRPERPVTTPAGDAGSVTR